MKGFRTCQWKYDHMEHPDFYRDYEEPEDEEQSGETNEQCSEETSES